MGIIERIVPGLGTGPSAGMRIPGTRSHVRDRYRGGSTRSGPGQW
jgi:hypothetical protein